MVSSQDQGKLLHRSINACLCPLYAVEGMHVVTVEGTLTFRPVSGTLPQCPTIACGIALLPCVAFISRECFRQQVSVLLQALGM